MKYNLPFRPRSGFFGDPVPFYWQGRYHVFYIGSPPNDPIARRWLSKQGVGHSYWGHVVSDDLLHWEELSDAIPLGQPGEPDSAGSGTGSVIEKDGLFHIFYLGRMFHGTDTRSESICHATSRNLVTWTKNPENPILPPDTSRYETADWRDPFVFWNQKDHCYWMLITARTIQGPPNRRGCIALAKSDDLLHWKVLPPFWDPGLYITLECPDLFQWNSLWYMVYSEFTSTTVTRYCVSDSLGETFCPHAFGQFDGTSFYAAKTISDGRRRFLLGWIHTRERDSDEGPYQWGGDLGIPRELTPGSDGMLEVRCPPEILSAFPGTAALDWRFTRGTWDFSNNTAVAHRSDGYGYAIAEAVPAEFCLQASLKLSGACDAGFLIHANDDLTCGYEIRVSSRNNMARISKLFGKPRQVITQNHVAISPSSRVECSIVVRGTVLEVFIGNQISLSCRIYEKLNDSVGLFVEFGAATFEVRSLAPI